MYQVKLIQPNNLYPANYLLVIYPEILPLRVAQVIVKFSHVLRCKFTYVCVFYKGLRKKGMESQYFDLIKFDFFGSNKRGNLIERFPWYMLLLS